jgi:hypothetical protein
MMHGTTNVKFIECHLYLKLSSDFTRKSFVDFPTLDCFSKLFTKFNEFKNSDAVEIELSCLQPLTNTASTSSLLWNQRFPSGPNKWPVAMYDLSALQWNCAQPTSGTRVIAVVSMGNVGISTLRLLFGLLNQLNNVEVKGLLVSGCEWTSPICTVIEFLNSSPNGTNTSKCCSHRSVCCSNAWAFEYMKLYIHLFMRHLVVVPGAQGQFVPYRFCRCGYEQLRLRMDYVESD